MTHMLSSIVGAASLIVSPSMAQAKEERVSAPIVFFDIAGPASAKQAEFYEQVFGWKAGAGGIFSVPVSGPMLPGTLRSDPAGKVIYLGVADIAATQKEIIEHGGRIVAPRFEVKGVAVLGLFADPAGNGMGLVELASDGKPKVP